MRVFADKLSDQLHRQLHNAYLLFGNEPLLLQESRELILSTAKEQGFDEKHSFTLDAQLDWNEVYDACTALSLFSNRQIIELIVPENGINAAQSNELVKLSEMIHSDLLVLLIGEKLTKQQEGAKWFKALSQNGIWVSCLSPDLQRLPQFVLQRCRRLNLKPDSEATQMLAQWHEGNLLALAQSLEKLSLLYPDGELNLVRVESALSRHNHFSPFHWMDSLLEGKPNRAQRIQRQLELEGVEPIILIRTLQRELNLVVKMKSELLHSTIGAVFDKNRIWQAKRPYYSASLQRLDERQIKTLYRTLAQIEVLAKTQYDTPVWPYITQLSIEFCSTQPTRVSNLIGS